MRHLSMTATASTEDHEARTLKATTAPSSVKKAARRSRAIQQPLRLIRAGAVWLAVQNQGGIGILHY